ncbi:hypothetical protein KBC70_01175 [Candidatus Woesebacteria bacterium]|jgi:hypothetical protein|nr:hypothetical protein [Candidatus Woesebacteria bacterium]
MENLKKTLMRKQTLVLMLLGLVLALSISAVSTTTSYLYRSRADENPEILRLEQDSVAIAPIDTRSHSCIKSLTYLPNESGDGCFAQIECEDTIDSLLPATCSQKNETVSCMSAVECTSRQGWIDQAKSICGC